MKNVIRYIGLFILVLVVVAGCSVDTGPYHKVNTQRYAMAWTLAGSVYYDDSTTNWKLLFTTNEDDITTASYATGTNYFAKQNGYWEAEVDLSTTAPAERDVHTIYLQYENGSSTTVNVYVAGIAEACPRITTIDSTTITYPDGTIAADSTTPTFTWIAPIMSTTVYSSLSADTPVFADGYTIKVKSGTTVLWSKSGIDAASTAPYTNSIQYNSDSTATTALANGTTYSVEVHFFDYGGNSSIDTVDFTVP
ncbi:MAG: hypothetical protein GY754_23295 [bacterium]|nr:hypothetical protein [bacterium]